MIKNSKTTFVKQNFACLEVVKNGINWMEFYMKCYYNTSAKLIFDSSKLVLTEFFPNNV